MAAGMEVIYGGPSQIFADRNILFRILLNLARNTGVTGTIGLQIDIWGAGHLGVIDTLDNGFGIGDNARRNLFQAFKTTKTGGNLKLTRPNGDGSEFRLHLPGQIFLT